MIRARVVDLAALRRWPLPALDADADKEDRGRVLVIAGSPAMPGAATLCCEAALRAGAGKVQLVSDAATARIVAAQVPELHASAPSAARLVAQAQACAVVAIGPGLDEGAELRRRLRGLLGEPRLARVALVVDAAALIELAALRRPPRTARVRLVLTPHAGEMAAMLGVTKRRVLADPAAAATACARRFAAVAMLKGPETWIAEPSGALRRCGTGEVGLATAGSGDVQTGLIAALLARGATPAQAAAWGAWVHGRCGEALDREIGRVGYLAREIAARIPAVLQSVAGARGGALTGTAGRRRSAR